MLGGRWKTWWERVPPHKAVRKTIGGGTERGMGGWGVGNPRVDGSIYKLRSNTAFCTQRTRATLGRHSGTNVDLCTGRQLLRDASRNLHSTPTSDPDSLVQFILARVFAEKLGTEARDGSNIVV